MDWVNTNQSKSNIVVKHGMAWFFSWSGKNWLFEIKIMDWFSVLKDFNTCKKKTLNFYIFGEQKTFKMT